EDGIRDYKVTGVQTCALPISGRDPSRRCPGKPRPSAGPARHRRRDRTLPFSMETERRPAALSPLARHAGAALVPSWAAPAAVPRSEERRVGKEWRARWAADEE